MQTLRQTLVPAIVRKFENAQPTKRQRTDKHDKALKVERARQLMEKIQSTSFAGS